MTTLVNQAVEGIVNRVDRWQRSPSRIPSRKEETTRFPTAGWDLRTLIAVFPPEAPFRFLNLNVVAGLTGLPFDRRDRLGGIAPEKAFDLQFCLQGRERSATYKGYHRLGTEVTNAPDEVQIRLPSRLRFEGGWPSYEIEYLQPEDDLELKISLVSQPDFHWWVHTPGFYSHYTSFTNAKVAWKWQGEAGTLETPLLHDHGWGRNLRAFSWALRLFRYEILRLPDGGHLITLACEGPGGLVLRRTGLLRAAKGPTLSFSPLTTEVLAWDERPNYQGVMRRLPRSWRCNLGEGPDRLEYEATLATEPAPLLGDGFLHAFDYRARGPAFGGEIQGEGYAEQLGQMKRK